MIMRITFNDFVKAFEYYGRAGQFTQEALELIFDRLEENNPNYELDVIEICCTYTEEAIVDVASNLNLSITEFLCDSELLQLVYSRLKDALMLNDCSDLYQYIVDNDQTFDGLSAEELFELLTEEQREEILDSFNWADISEQVSEELSNYTCVLGVTGDCLVYMSY